MEKSFSNPRIQPLLAMRDIGFPVSPLGRGQVLWGMLEEKEEPVGHLEGEGVSTADLWLPAPAAYLSIYHKNNASVRWVELWLLGGEGSRSC